MRISDWSSDVCSSDLLVRAQETAGTHVHQRIAAARFNGVAPGKRPIGVGEERRPPRQRLRRAIARKVHPVRLGPAKRGKPFGRAQLQMTAVILVTGVYDGPAVAVPSATPGGVGGKIDR